MKLFVPSYYKKFKCIADKCRHSCCVDWEIDIDDAALLRYTKLTHGYADNIRGSIEEGERSHFRLGSDGRCPHLDKNGLCEIIKNLGDEYLCDICREHPRFYNEVPGGFEVGVGASCEEAARLILSADEYCDIADFEEDSFSKALPYKNEIREKIYSILSETESSYAERISEIYREFGVSPEAISDKEWRKIIRSFEYIDVKNSEVFSSYSSKLFSLGKEADAWCERALAYFVFRYCELESGDCEIGFALFLERLFASLLKERMPLSFGEAAEILRMISEEIEYSTDNGDIIKNEFLGF